MKTSDFTQLVPEVGMGATQHFPSDCYPYTIVEVINPKTIVVQGDIAKPAKGYDWYSNQVYTYSPNIHSTKRILTLRKNGRWIEKGEPLNRCGYSIGNRRKYQAPEL